MGSMRAEMRRIEDVGDRLKEDPNRLMRTQQDMAVGRQHNGLPVAPNVLGEGSACWVGSREGLRKVRGIGRDDLAGLAVPLVGWEDFLDQGPEPLLQS